MARAAGQSSPSPSAGRKPLQIPWRRDHDSVEKCRTKVVQDDLPVFRIGLGHVLGLDHPGQHLVPPLGRQPLGREQGRRMAGRAAVVDDVHPFRVRQVELRCSATPSVPGRRARCAGARSGRSRRRPPDPTAPADRNRRQRIRAVPGGRIHRRTLPGRRKPRWQEGGEAASAAASASSRACSAAAASASAIRCASASRKASLRARQAVPPGRPRSGHAGIADRSDPGGEQPPPGQHWSRRSSSPCSRRPSMPAAGRAGRRAGRHRLRAGPPSSKIRRGQTANRAIRCCMLLR